MGTSITVDISQFNNLDALIGHIQQNYPNFIAIPPEGSRIYFVTGLTTIQNYTGLINLQQRNRTIFVVIREIE